MRSDRKQSRDASDAAREHDFEVIDSAVQGVAMAEPDDAALTNFALAVRSARPEPEAGFTVELEERIARLGAGEGSGSERVPVWRRRRPQVVAICCVAVLFAASVTVVSLNAPQRGLDMSSGQDDAAVFMDRSTSQAAPASGDLSELAKQPSEATQQSIDSLTSSRDVVRGASLRIGTGLEDFNDTTDEVVAITDRLGGFVRESRVTDGTADDPLGRMTLMVPATKLQSALASISELGTVLEREQQLDDVTSSVSRTDRRVDQLRARRQTLLGRLGDATTDQQKASILVQLRRNAARLSRAVAEQRSLQRRIRYSELSVVVEASAKRDNESVIAKGWNTAKSALEVIVAVAIVALAITLPIAILAFAVLFAARWWRRRARDRAIDSAAEAPTQAT